QAEPRKDIFEKGGKARLRRPIRGGGIEIEPYLAAPLRWLRRQQRPGRGSEDHLGVLVRANMAFIDRQCRPVDPAGQWVHCVPVNRVTVRRDFWTWLTADARPGQPDRTDFGLSRDLDIVGHHKGELREVI